MAEKKMTKAPVKKATSKAKKADEVKSLDQLRADLDQKRTDLIETKRSHAAGELVNPRAITSQRKDVARLSTAIRSLELTEQKESK